MNSGDLRHSIELQAFTSVSDNMGGFAQTWSTQATVFAAIWPGSATEQKRAAAPTMTISHTIRIRYYAGIGASWRIKFGTRYFSIGAIIDKDEKHVQMDLLCKEVMA